MPEITVKIKNKRSVQRFFSDAPGVIEGEMKRAVERSFWRLYNSSQKRDVLAFKNPTGTLKASFRKRSFARGLSATLRPNVEYAGFVHDGTKYLRPRRHRIGGRSVLGYNPYMYSILADAEDKIDKEFNDAVDRSIKKMT